MTTTTHKKPDALAFNTHTAAFKDLFARSREYADLSAILGLLGWDQQTQMAMGANGVRGEQLATIEAVIHEKMTSPKLGNALAKAEAILAAEPEHYSAADQALVRELRRTHDHAVKLPEEFVKAYSVATSQGWETWQRARAAKDFSLFAPDLAHIVDLTRQKAQYLNPQGDPYAALFDEFEPGMPLAEAERALDTLRTATVKLLKRVQAAPQIDNSFLKGVYADEQQMALSRTLLGVLGYEFEHGRLDLAAHPFESSIGSPYDARVTTRIHRDDVVSCIMSVMHECGHALYEQGIEPALARTILANGTSSAIHESQSRTWENIIGRSEPFWQAHFGKLQAAFPAPFAQVQVADFVRAINRAEASLIRVEADELTYNLHIIIRFEIERALFAGMIEVKDLPQIWNQKYHDYLGITPPDDSQGVMQDVHWSAGLFGYFPTYSLGNIWSAQFAAKLRQDHPTLDDRLAAGETAFIREWQREKLHQWGKVYEGHDMGQRAAGEAMNPDYLIAYLTAKYERLYGLK